MLFKFIQTVSAPPVAISLQCFPLLLSENGAEVETALKGTQTIINLYSGTLPKTIHIHKDRCGKFRKE